MAIFFGNDDSTYISLRPLTERRDSNGKIWIWVAADVSLTANHPMVCRVSTQGWAGMRMFDTGLASTTAAGRRFKVGVPLETIPSGSHGFCSMLEETQSVTTGNIFRWVDATVTGAGIAAANAASGAGLCDAFAVAMATTSATTFDIFLMNKWACGTS